MVWVIGCAGMLGKELTGLLAVNKIDFVSSDREVDITDLKSLKDYAEGKNIDWIINCSAYTAVDMAEDEEETAYKINRDGVYNIALTAKEINAKVIHISTDYVFDGNTDVSLKETDVTKPLSVYGKSKLAGEKSLAEVFNNYFIIRTAWLYGKYGKNFVYTMLKLFNKVDTLKVVNDQFGTPTHAVNLVYLILNIINNNSNEYGIYHYTDEGRISWFDFAEEIYQSGKMKGYVKKDVNILPVTSDQYPTKAVRPKFSCLDKSKVKKVFNFTVPDWKAGLSAFLDDHDENFIN